MKRKLLFGLSVLLCFYTMAFGMKPEQIIWGEETLTCTDDIVSYQDATDVTEEEQNCLQVLYALDIMQGDGNQMFRPHDTITRAEMAKILVAVQNLPVIEFAESGFSDVSQSHWAKNAIAMVNSQGIMIGEGGGVFAPDRNLTLEELCKVVTVVLGYLPMAETTGGYPDGYVHAVNKYIIQDKMDFSCDKNTPVTRLDTAKIMYYVLQAPLMEQTTFGAPEHAEYAILDGSQGTEFVNLLSRNFLIPCK
ncbi:MAG: S-layer homology domain-containing protein [Clostridia bacterium]|nr:S-layer homology domain-containing protein [Clostridia bacterium]